MLDLQGSPVNREYLELLDDALNMRIGLHRIVASSVVICIKFIKKILFSQQFNLQLHNKCHWMALTESYLLVVKHRF